MNSTDFSAKSRLVVLLLCFFFGIVGVHRFYVGKTGTGVLQIIYHRRTRYLGPH